MSISLRLLAGAGRHVGVGVYGHCLRAYASPPPRNQTHAPRTRKERLKGTERQRVWQRLDTAFRTSSTAHGRVGKVPLGRTVPLDHHDTSFSEKVMKRHVDRHNEHSIRYEDLERDLPMLGHGAAKERRKRALKRDLVAFVEEHKPGIKTGYWETNPLSRIEDHDMDSLRNREAQVWGTTYDALYAPPLEKSHEQPSALEKVKEHYEAHKTKQQKSDSDTFSQPVREEKVIRTHESELESSLQRLRHLALQKGVWLNDGPNPFDRVASRTWFRRFLAGELWRTRPAQSQDLQHKLFEEQLRGFTIPKGNKEQTAAVARLRASQDLSTFKVHWGETNLEGLYREASILQLWRALERKRAAHGDCLDDAFRAILKTKGQVVSHEFIEAIIKDFPPPERELFMQIAELVVAGWKAEGEGDEDKPPPPTRDERQKDASKDEFEMYATNKMYTELPPQIYEDKWDLSNKGLLSFVVTSNKVCRVTTRGRTYSYRALVVVGTGHGAIGWGFGKALSSKLAIKHAYQNAVQNVIPVEVDVQGRLFIPGKKMVAKYGATQLAFHYHYTEGLVCCNLIRQLCFLAGIKRISCKVHGNRNEYGIVKAFFKALLHHKTPQQLQIDSGKTLLNIAEMNMRPYSERLWRYTNEQSYRTRVRPETHKFGGYDVILSQQAREAQMADRRRFARFVPKL